MDALREKATAFLKKFFGYSAFRPGQFEIVEAVCSGRDAVVLMPTGGGKSLCFQIPALMMDGCAVIISPLIALMEDQTEALLANGVPAAAIHSNSSESHNREVIEAVLQGKIKLLYISPERLLSDIDSWVSRIPVNLIAVDEAHCISQWGHDFRPVYTQLSVIKEHFPAIPIMALTATADRITREDITKLLKLKNPLRWIGSFDRPNLSIRVEGNVSKKYRLTEIERMIKKYPLDSGIVYTLSRKGAEDIGGALAERGYRCVVYHAGMSATERAEAQRAFINGDVQVVCATIAFGMGIDKSNIRWVIHYNLPGNIESYYQEIGRAGRDGLPSETILFYSYQDLIMRRRFIQESGQPLVAAEKLKAMERYADAGICRRRILLSYFNERVEHDCGNCDVCLNPPERFDGTVLVKKAGSAVIRLNSEIGIMTLVDVLRGSSRAEIVRNGYDRIPTYGVGRDMSAQEWNAYIGQMIQLGILDVAFNKGNHLSVTPYGMKVIRGEANVEFSKFYPYNAKNVRPEKNKPVRIDPDEELFQKLKETRKSIAAAEGMAPYMVFSDATLLDMVRRHPVTIENFMAVDGVGVRKCISFGKKFLGVIRKFRGLPASMPRGTARLEILIMHNAGIPAAEMAEIKGVSIETVKSHVAALINEKALSSWKGYVGESEFEEIARLLKRDNEESRQQLYKNFSSGSIAVVSAVIGLLPASGDEIGESR